MTAVGGLILVIRRDYVLMFAMPIKLLFRHVEAGVVMTVISLFHLSWHLKYYRDLFRHHREGVSAAGENECVREADKE
jgi:hypothetical protein